MTAMLPTEYLVKELFWDEYPNYPGLDTHNTVPDSIMQNLAHYVAYGMHPGRFLTAVIGNDLFLAASRADHENKPKLAIIATWVYFALDNADTRAAKGDSDVVNAWCKSDNQARIALLDKLEREFVWDTLKT